MALQRVLLTATDAGLAASDAVPADRGARRREQLRLALGRFGSPQMVLRIGYGERDGPAPPTAVRTITAAV